MLGSCVCLCMCIYNTLAICFLYHRNYIWTSTYVQVNRILLSSQSSHDNLAALISSQKEQHRDRSVGDRSVEEVFVSRAPSPSALATKLLHSKQQHHNTHNTHSTPHNTHNIRHTTPHHNNNKHSHSTVDTSVSPRQHLAYSKNILTQYGHQVCVYVCVCVCLNCDCVYTCVVYVCEMLSVVDVYVGHWYKLCTGVWCISMVKRETVLSISQD